MEDTEYVTIRENCGDWIETASQCLADDDDVRSDVFVFEGEQLSAPPKSGLDFVGDKENIVLLAQTGRFVQISLRWDDNTSFTLDWFYKKSGSVAVDLRSQIFDVSIADDWEARCVWPEAKTVLLVCRETDNCCRAAVKIPLGTDNLGLVLRNPLYGVPPFANRLDCCFDSLATGIHRQGHVVTGKVVKVFVEKRKLVVAECPARERQFPCLFGECLKDFRMAVSLVDCRIRCQAVKITSSFDVGEPDPFTASDDNIQGVVIMGAVSFFKLDVLLCPHVKLPPGYGCQLFLIEQHRQECHSDEETVL